MQIEYLLNNITYTAEYRVRLNERWRVNGIDYMFNEKFVVSFVQEILFAMQSDAMAFVGERVIREIATATGYKHPTVPVPVVRSVLEEVRKVFHPIKMGGINPDYPIKMQIVDSMVEWYAKQTGLPKTVAGLEILPAVSDSTHVYGGHEFNEAKANSYEEPTLSGFARKLPGVNERVEYPCNRDGFIYKVLGHVDEGLEDCLWLDQSDTIYQIVIHLNDRHRLTRDEIADWLETLDVDLSFKEVEDGG